MSTAPLFTAFTGIDEIEAQGYPAEYIKGLMDGVDCNIYFFDNKVEKPYMYACLGSTVILLIAAYVVMNIVKNKKTV